MDSFGINRTYFPTDLQQYVFYDKYSRFRPDLGRRENWPESVDRVVGFLRELSQNKLPERDYQDIREAILGTGVAPSMRLFATAGAEARRNNLALFNCAYLPIVSIEAISELLWISMSGVGAGYSVESAYVSQLPVIAPQRRFLSVEPIVVDDSAEGWTVAFLTAMRRWWNGLDPAIDYSKIRPAGAPLRTKGGVASGPEVLQQLMMFTRNIIISNSGSKLRPIDVFDICTMVGMCAVSGGSRRSAQLTMFDFDDKEMMNAKAGEYWNDNPHRANANISAVFTRLMDKEEMIEFVMNMHAGKTGEPGIVSRLAMNATRPVRRRALDHGGVNACAEINLHGTTADGRFGGQFCNLSSVQVYAGDTLSALEEKVRLAAIIGTIQAMATDFRMLRPEWKEICEEERLLGVSLIGLMDNPLAQTPATLNYLRTVAVKTNEEYAKKLGINQAAAVTCIKPSGNSSALYGVARGLNARFSQYYKRRVRVNAYTPMYKVLQYSGIDMLPENGYSEDEASTFVATFYERSPDGAVTINETPTMVQLENWKKAKLSWCEHNPSVTIEYSSGDLPEMVRWLYGNQLLLNGLAFLPRTEHVYQQAPYEEITAESFSNGVKSTPRVDFSLFEVFETFDQTERFVECSAGVCDLV